MDEVSEKFAEIFSSRESLEQLKSLMNMLGSNMGTSAFSLKNTVENPHSEERKMADFINSVDIEKLISIQRKFSEGSAEDKQNEALFLALRPLLSPERQARIPYAIQLMKLIRLLPALNESGLLSTDGV